MAIKSQADAASAAPPKEETKEDKKTDGKKQTRITGIPKLSIFLMSEM